MHRKCMLYSEGCLGKYLIMHEFLRHCQNAGCCSEGGYTNVTPEHGYDNNTQYLSWCVLKGKQRIEVKM